MAGNPVLSAPDSGRLDEALPMLDAMISVDNWLNETTRHAHVILPGLVALEQPHCDEALWGFAVRSAVRWSPAIFPRDDRPQEWEILIRLGAILAGVPAADVDVDGVRRRAVRRARARGTASTRPTSWTRRRCAAPTASST